MACSETQPYLLMISLFPEFQTGVVPASDENKANKTVAMAMDFEAKHRECVRVLTYDEYGHFKVKLFVLAGKSCIPETLKAAARDFFKDVDVEFEWLDLYRHLDEILKTETLTYPSGTQQALNDAEMKKMNKIVSENLHVLVRHRNITAVQPSLKIKNSEQTETPCITFYVLCKGVIPYGECLFPTNLGPYPVDVVDGIWFRTDDPWLPSDAQKQSEVLRLGASIGVQKVDAAGTLGAIVKDGKTFYVLSCDHVMKHDTKLEIIHPAWNDYLNCLRYYLKAYGSKIQQITEKKSCDIRENQFPLDHNLGPEELLEKFKEQKEKVYRDNETINERNLQCLKQYEEAFERGYEKPRVIAKYSFGISGNVTWEDGQQYYIDAALAELIPEEVSRLKQNQAPEIIGKYGLIGKCSTGLNVEEKLFKSGRTTGLTKCASHVKPSICLSRSLYEVNAQNNCYFSVLKRVILCQSCKKGSEIGEQLESTDTACDCEKEKTTLTDSLWLKNCLCIGYLDTIGREKFFASLGDSGAVVFEQENEGDDFQAHGIIFAVHQDSYKHCALATPMHIALANLSRKISKVTNLSLVSDHKD